MLGKWGLYGLFCWALAVPACGGFEHDCVETRDCAGPKGFIEAGGNSDWWQPSNAGVAGELGVGFPPPEVASPSNSAGGSDGAEGPESAAGAASTASTTLDSAPAVLGVSPADGAEGVRNDTTIVIRFAQAMDTEATEAAYQSSDLPARSVNFGWDSARSTLTISPRLRLEYATGTPSCVAKTYHYGFDGSARARSGQALPAMQFAFSTLRQVSNELSADAERTGNWTDSGTEGIHNCLRAAKAPYTATVCVGDDANNARYTGFLSFDLSALPSTISAFESAHLQASAVVYGTPESLGDSRVEHVSFEQLGDSALRAAALAALGPFYSGPSPMQPTHITLDQDLTSAVQDDYTNLIARANRSQYRLSFAKVAPDGSWDDLELATSEIRLALIYLVP